MKEILLGAALAFVLTTLVAECALDASGFLAGQIEALEIGGQQ